jgi:hypothetical protein
MQLNSSAEKVMVVVKCSELDLDKMDFEGKSPLFYAISLGFFDIADYLYDHGALVICPNDEMGRYLCM